MSHQQLWRRLQRLEQRSAPAAARADCRCPDSALFVATTMPTLPRCPRCGHACTTVTVDDLPAGSSAPIPPALLAPLRHASTSGGRLDLAQLSDHDLDQLAAALSALAALAATASSTVASPATCHARTLPSTCAACCA
jgi:hypothetical protein